MTKDVDLKIRPLITYQPIQRQASICNQTDVYEKSEAAAHGQHWQPFANDKPSCPDDYSAQAFPLSPDLSLDLVLDPILGERALAH